MRFRSIAIGSTSLLATLWIASSVHAAPILFQDGFEGRTPGTFLSASPPPVGDHYATNIGTAADSTTNPPGAAATGTRFASAGTGFNRWFVSTATQSSITGKTINFNVNFYIVQDLVNFNKGIDFNTFTDGGFGGRGFDIIIHSNGSLEWYDGSFHSVAGTVATNAWINADVTANFAAGTYNATINGVSFSGLFSGGAGHATNFLNVLTGADQGQNGALATYFYDDILIQVPEPVGGILLVLGLSIASRRSTRSTRG